MHIRARERAAVDGSPELISGVNYLHSIGRTRTPFAKTRREVLAGCARNIKGEIQIFPIF